MVTIVGTLRYSREIDADSFFKRSKHKVKFEKLCRKG